MEGREESARRHTLADIWPNCADRAKELENAQLSPIGALQLATAIGLKIRAGGHPLPALERLLQVAANKARLRVAIRGSAWEILSQLLPRHWYCFRVNSVEEDRNSTRNELFAKS